MILKSFITSQFGYFPLIWMFHSRVLNNKFNSIHERALRITNNDNKSTFKKHKKIKNHAASEVLHEMFAEEDTTVQFKDTLKFV